VVSAVDALSATLQRPSHPLSPLLHSKSGYAAEFLLVCANLQAGVPMLRAEEKCCFGMSIEHLHWSLIDLVISRADYCTLDGLDYRKIGC